MIRPEKMKRIELMVLVRDADRVIEFLGRNAAIHFAEEDRVIPSQVKTARNEELYAQISRNLEKIRHAAAYLEIGLPAEPDEAGKLPGIADNAAVEALYAEIAAVRDQEIAETQEKKKLEHTLGESKSFASLNAPFKDFDQLSYLTLRIGHIDPKGHAEVRDRLSERAVVIPLGENRVLAAASRKGRFALDSELKKYSFAPLIIPEGFRGIPQEMLTGLETRLKEVDGILEAIAARKTELRRQREGEFRRLASAYIMASIVENLKTRLIATQSVFFLTGWVPATRVSDLAKKLTDLTEGRISVRTFVPEEVERVTRGAEKVPVSLQHGAFVKGFERVVFSYGAPLYGAIDPTPFVAAFFAILFGIMFGDVGQGLVLLAFGILTSPRGLKKLAGMRVYSTPLIAVGIASAIMGFLTGEVFTNEKLLAGPVRGFLGLFMADPPDRILHLMPDANHIEKLFYFFGFTIGVGVIFNSIGLWVNVINQFALKKYEKALFAKNGLAGIVVFWYALFIGIRCLAGGSVALFDALGLGIPAFCIFFGPMLWRLIAGERPLLEEGLMTFIMEGFVEILETLSTYISNTVSFLRVGAFALSHAVLSFIVFTLAEMVVHLPAGTLFSLVVMIFGNTVIILLEGMIVAIQVVRLQYYEFFSKFFTETGVEFKPFQFRGKVVSNAVGSQKAFENSD
ncbi:MAG: V-type ATP synthase subunit I [Spirochaetaceae bacterium]|nr:V-type ATP synthase subunit I [Spirochaetaceae bacterium]